MRISDWSSDVCSSDLVILPNNKNIIPVAEQVGAQTDKTVLVVPTKGITEGFAALLAYDPEADGATNAEEMAEAAANVVAGEITQAVRDSSRSDERRVGKEGVSQCQSRWSPYH